MDKELIKRAKELTKRLYSVIPVIDKNPCLSGWTEFQQRPMNDEEFEKYFNENSKGNGIALLMGGTNAITAVDFDVKYSLDKDFYNKILDVIPVSLYKKMFVTKTLNGGYHWIFSCEKGIGNVKLAERHTTEEEKEKTRVESLELGFTKAMKAGLSDKTRVLIETRSFTTMIKADRSKVNKSDGYVIFPPTFGYKHLEGKIGKLTLEEFDSLMSILRSFNEYNVKAFNLSGNQEFWEEANNQINTVELLLEHGWKIINERSNEVRLLRPGQVSSTTSGIYHKDTNVFVCFSTSTSFESGKGYSPAMVFIELVADGDINIAKQKLLNGN